MASTAYVSFCKTGGSNENYRIRFSRLASVLFDGVEWVKISKTMDYIVLTPLQAREQYAFHVCRDPYNAAWISFVYLVRREGEVSKTLFGKRYKVKRDKKGRIYICLNEVVGYVGNRE